MNRIVLNQTGGFPLETDAIAAMQTAYGLFNALGAMAGELAIISGCKITGASVGDGTVYINGEVLDFKGGTIAANVIIKEDTENRVFEDGQSKPVYKTRYATFGSATTSYLWDDFQRFLPLLELQRRILPPLTNPQLYSGSINSIPDGWQLCDGSNGAPDLRGRFIVGYDPADGDYNAIGKKGGAKEVTLTEAQMPSHSHAGSTDQGGQHSHSGTAAGPYSGTDIGGGFKGGDNNFKSRAITVDQGGQHSHQLTTDNKGGGQAHENRPPYYTLAYIIYTG